jgi:nicotinamidase-related amidase
MPDMSAAFTDLVPEIDRKLYEALGYGARAGLGRRPALIIVDANIAFCGEESMPIFEAIKRSRTSCGEYAWKAIPVIGRLAGVARSRGIPVIYTTNAFRDDLWDAGSWRFKKRMGGPQAAAPALDRGNEIVPAIAPTPTDIVVTKQKPSGFFGSNLASYLTLLRCDSLVVCGGTTSGCVRATVLDAFSLNYRVAVAADGCFDRFQASHQLSLFDMHCRYADVMPGEEIVQYMQSIEEAFETP